MRKPKAPKKKQKDLSKLVQLRSEPHKGVVGPIPHCAGLPGDRLKYESAY